jgi:arabinose-5-phosphate isomerase
MTPDEILKAARRVLEVEAEAVRALAERLDDRFTRAVQLLLACQGRVVVTGIGKSGLVARKLAATLTATGTPALFLHPAEAVHGDLGMVVRGDVVVALSNSGETGELLALLPSIKRLGVPLIVLTGSLDSRLAGHGDVVLDVSVQEEACPLNLTPTASTTATLALGDALAVALLARRGISPEDVARVHPGGALGRRLIQVEELMHRGAAVPRVREDARLAEALGEMTAKRLGCTTVVDGGGRLAGIITDGDVRRAVERGGVLPATAGDLMTRRPKTVGRTELAAAALALMERHAITQLLVVDDDGRPDGILHLHDLLRATIA